MRIGSEDDVFQGNVIRKNDTDKCGSDVMVLLQQREHLLQILYL